MQTAASISRPDSENYELLDTAEPADLDEEGDQDVDDMTVVGTPTLDNKTSRKSSTSSTLNEANLISSPSPKWTVLSLLRIPLVRTTMACQFMLDLVGAGMWAVTLLFFYEPVNKGGLGLQVSSIGNALVFEGLAAIACTILLLTRVKERLGLIRAYQLTNGCQLLQALGLPILRQIVLFVEGNQAGEDQSQRRSIITWTCVMGFLFLSTFPGLAYSYNMLVINRAAPDRGCIAAMNGLANAVG